MAGRLALLFAATALIVAAPAQAERIRIAGTWPAASDEGASLSSVAIGRIEGQYGRELGDLIEDRLETATVNGAAWLRVSASPRGAGAHGAREGRRHRWPDMGGRGEGADDRDREHGPDRGAGFGADAMIVGVAQPEYYEDSYYQPRTACVARDAARNCTSTASVQVRCRRITLTLEPEVRVIAGGGREIWHGSARRSQDYSWCPKFEEAPDPDGDLGVMLEELAGQVRSALVPSDFASNIQLMDHRGDLPGEAQGAFNNAVRQAGRDPRSGCPDIVALQQANPSHPALTFDAGLCAEFEGNFDEAERFYQAATQFGHSRGEGRDGLARIAARRRAQEQLARHGGR